MIEGTKPCKVCGTSFVPCLTQSPSGFNWRTVTCSPECGQIYLHKIMVSRGLIVEEQPKPEEPAVLEEVAEEEIEVAEEAIVEEEAPRKKKK